MKNYVRPTESELPQALAEVMGGKTDYCGDAFTARRPWWKDESKKWVWIVAHEDFSPLTDRNHSRLAVERCAELGLKLEYGENLAELLNCQVKICDALIDYRALLATPAQESFAAHKTLTEHLTKGKT